MATWLLKTEPSAFAWADLVREGTTSWTGVSNATAQRNLKAMRLGDRAVVYHSGEKRAVGLAEVVRTAYPDPTAGGKLVCVDLRAVEPLPAPVALEALRREAAFRSSPLLRQGRLSVVPISAGEWSALRRVAREAGKSAALRS